MTSSTTAWGRFPTQKNTYPENIAPPFIAEVGESAPMSQERQVCLPTTAMAL